MPKLNSFLFFFKYFLEGKNQFCDITQLHSHDFYHKICSNDSQTPSAFFWNIIRNNNKNVMIIWKITTWKECDSMLLSTKNHMAKKSLCVRQREEFFRRKRGNKRMEHQHPVGFCSFSYRYSEKWREFSMIFPLGSFFTSQA